MSDEEYIRKAVELAEGWYFFDDDRVECCTNGHYTFDVDDQIFLDALAAQLARQVDAIEGIEFDSKGSNEVYVWDHRPGKNRVAAHGISTDRTSNTIKAIVDSGVLETVTNEWT